MRSSAADERERAQAYALVEPYRIKTVERIELRTREERARIMRDAFYSVMYLNAADVFVDLGTDSGTGAMSDEQWSALMRGDEAYVRSRNFSRFEQTVREVTGFGHVIPTHQGRGAENILMTCLLKQGDLVLSNAHFDTTRAHVQTRGALPVDLVGDALWSFAEEHPFKGDFDLEKLRVALARYHERVACVVITVTNNLACSSPVSMANIRAVSALARQYGVRVFFDACRFAENAYFIKTRESGYGDKSVAEIAREMFAHGDGCWMSAKKDALVNVGGFLALTDEGLARRCQEQLVLYEGFPTYGGLARRDLEAISVGLREGLDEPYLRHRTSLVAYLGGYLEQVAKLKVSKPIGGSGVFVDVQALYSHLGVEELPGIAFACDMYLEGGVRVGAIPFHMHTVSLPDGELVMKDFQFARLAVPRRVYTCSHLDYVIEVARRVQQRAHANAGYRVLEMPEVLGHFFAKFAPRERG